MAIQSSYRPFGTLQLEKMFDIEGIGTLFFEAAKIRKKRFTLTIFLKMLAGWKNVGCLFEDSLGLGLRRNGT